LAANILLDLFLYVHMFCSQLRARDYRTFNPFETLPYSVTKPSSHSGRIVRKPYLGITSRLPVI
jgi:hypothetical protein